MKNAGGFCSEGAHVCKRSVNNSFAASYDGVGGSEDPSVSTAVVVPAVGDDVDLIVD